jgi:hypothetical protein
MAALPISPEIARKTRTFEVSAYSTCQPRIPSIHAAFRPIYRTTRPSLMKKRSWFESRIAHWESPANSRDLLCSELEGCG